jgi:uncharacterized protein (TIGR03067 family)
MFGDSFLTRQEPKEEVMLSTLIASLLVAAAPPGAEDRRDRREDRRDDRKDDRRDRRDARGATLDGKWVVVYAEREGKKMDLDGKVEVTIKDNVVSYKDKEGKEHSIRLRLGPRFTFWVMGRDDKDDDKGGRLRDRIHHGVYVLSNEHLALSVNKFGYNIVNRIRNEKEDDDPKADGPAGTGHTGHFVFFLKRQGSSD